jgi:hypothetical protein
MVKKNIFVPKIEDRADKARSLGLVMRSKKPEFSQLTFLEPSVDWDSDKSGYVYLNPTYRLKCIHSPHLHKKNSNYDFVIEMRRMELDSMKIILSEWWKKNVNKSTTEEMINYFVRYVLSDSSFLDDKLRGQEDRLQKEWTDKFVDLTK